MPRGHDGDRSTQAVHAISGFCVEADSTSAHAVELAVRETDLCQLVEQDVDYFSAPIGDGRCNVDGGGSLPIRSAPGSSERR